MFRSPPSALCAQGRWGRAEQNLDKRDDVSVADFAQARPSHPCERETMMALWRWLAPIFPGKRLLIPKGLQIEAQL